MKNGLIIDNEGNRRYYLNDLLHRVDGPAEEWVDGANYWYLYGEFHRVDGPAVEYTDDETRWFLHGKLHRVDGPAIEYANGAKYWYLHGKELIHPKGYKTMEEFFTKLNTDEEYSLPWINEFNGIIDVIKNPTPKQKRLNAIKWKL